MTTYSNTRAVFSVFSQPTDMNKQEMSTLKQCWNAMWILR